MKSFVRWSLAVALGLVISSSASAQDAQVYPGIGCKPLNVDANSVRATEFFLVNNSPVPVPVVCPIVWGGTLPTEVLVQVDGRVRAQDSFTCTAFGATLISSSTTAQTTIFDRDTQSQQNRSPGSVVRDFALFLRLQVPTTAGLAVFSLTCELPRGGRIYTYIVSMSR